MVRNAVMVLIRWLASAAP